MTLPVRRWLRFAAVAAPLTLTYTAAKPVRPSASTAPGKRPVVVKATLVAAVERLLEQVSPEERTKILKGMVAAGLILDVPQLWQLDDPATIWKAINHFQEPYTAPMIAALERVQPNLKDPLDQDLAAAVLFRYGNNSAISFLEQRLTQDNDIVAAEFFAFQKTPHLLPAIFAAIQKNSDRSGTTILELRSWNSPDVVNGLLSAFRRDQDNANYVFPLADQNVRASEKLIRRLFNVSRPDEFGKAASAATLVKLGVPDKTELIAFLTRTLKSTVVDETTKSGVMRSLALTDATWSIGLLQDVIAQYTHEIPQGVQADQHDPHILLGRDDLATRAAVALASLHADTARSVVERLPLRLKAAHSDFQLRASAARSYLKMGGSPEFVERVMGMDWLKNESAKEALRPLPDSLLPPATFSHRSSKL